MRATEERVEERRDDSSSDSLPAPLQNTPVPMGTPVQGAVAALRAVAARARHALRSPDRLFRRVQQPVQHLADGAVFTVEGIGVHLDLRVKKSPGHSILYLSTL